MSDKNNFDVCSGGTIASSNSRVSLTFLNHHHEACNICDLNLPNADPAGPDYTVPAKSHGNPGTLTINFDPTPNSYPYTADCCDDETNPVIIVQ